MFVVKYFSIILTLLKDKKEQNLNITNKTTSFLSPVIRLALIGLI